MASSSYNIFTSVRFSCVSCKPALGLNSTKSVAIGAFFQASSSSKPSIFGGLVVFMATTFLTGAWEKTEQVRNENNRSKVNLVLMANNVITIRCDPQQECYTLRVKFWLKM